ncbi:MULTISPECIES: hypothetical protein [unclassified Brenneria]|uniref:hypothetical protein n=1 Tax=unclassified Brenneria TaxID=2634434 RepID=UPI0018F1001F|nr:hypothetical protein [Brenneria sp. L3-3C-1]MBJ7223566.1 hypothetical protein [Brenneria sp. L3-3C-1]MEE3644808.1 hypothetical protein [Brenneria sp. L3_3C_1]
MIGKHFLSMMWHYRLEGRRAVPCPDIAEWARWFAIADRRVAETWIDDFRVSTVFLGLDHNHNALSNDEVPVLFETMVFAGPDPLDTMRRYSLWEEAETGHAEIVAQLRQEMDTAQVAALEAWKALMARQTRST